MPKSTYY